MDEKELIYYYESLEKKGYLHLQKNNLSITIKQYTKDVALIIMGIFSAAFGFKGFLLSNHFIDGGATGISLLLYDLTSVPLYILLILVNIPFIFLGRKILGTTFAIKTVLAIFGLAFVLGTISFPDVTQDNFLSALFGGFFLGLGIGLSVRGGAVIDGTEILAIFLSKKIGTTIGDIIIIINVFIFSIAAYLLSVEIALYSMVTYLAASKTLDFVIDGIEEYTGVTIVSDQNIEIKKMLLNQFRQGILAYKGESILLENEESKDINILYTVVSRLELNLLKSELEKIDPHAFLIMSSIKDTKGGKIKKRILGH